MNGSIDGGNPEVSFYLDGGLNINGIRNYGNQLPNPDALEEFRVETSDFSAQYGHMSAQWSPLSPSRERTSFHGALFEFNRNTDFNAYPWNAPKNFDGALYQRSISPQPVRRRGWRPDQERQGVLLLQLWRACGRWWAQYDKRRQSSHGSRAAGRLYG